MSLSQEQFNELLKKASRHEKRTIAGERFIHQRVLGGPPLEDGLGNQAEWITHDGYGLESTPTGGLRSVFDPSGKIIEDVPTHKDGVRVIQEHRSKQQGS